MGQQQSQPTSPEQLSGANALTQEETRKILTPFAFEIDKSLFGVTLASPIRRALAILFDLLVIALLSDTPGEILALVLAITVYRLGGKKRASALGKKQGKKRRALLRGLGTFIVFVVLIDTLPPLFNFFSNDELQSDNLVSVSGESLSVKETLAFSALTAGTMITVGNSDCITLTCWQNELSPLIAGFATFNLRPVSLQEAMLAISDETNLNQQDQEQLQQSLQGAYQQAILEQEKTSRIENELTTESSDSEGMSNRADSNLAAVEDKTKNEQSAKPIYSLTKWFKGIINDLGLGFGWAAFYFTVFTAFWRGQTLGKKLLGIRVLQLDGTPLSLWDSFGRYGGYGAGLATGLLGFMQIFWDANRQAIHDKISATVVIDIRNIDK